MPAQFTKVKLPLSLDLNAASLVGTCTEQSLTIKQCPAYVTTPRVQAAVVDLDGAVVDLKDTESELVQARVTVTRLEGQRDVRMSAVRRKHDSVESALNDAADGDAVAAMAWVGQVKERAKPLPVGASILPPEGASLRTVKAHPGMILASCLKEPTTVGYAFQMGTDQTNPEGWPAPMVARGNTFKVGNLPIGQVVYLRIAVIRRGSIQGQWSPILSVQVR